MAIALSDVSAARATHARTTPPLRHARVAQVVLSLTPGGAERLVIETVRRLNDSVPMMVCCLDEPGAWADEVERLSVPVITLGRKPGFHPGLGVRLAGIAKAMGVRVLHCHQYSPFVYGQLATLVSARLRLVLTEHGRASDAPPSLKRRAVNSVISRLSGSFFAVSNELKGHMVAEGFPEDRVDVVHNGIEPGPPPLDEARASARRRLGVGASAFVTGTVARLDPVKDLTTLVAAFARVNVSDPDARLIIVGDGPERPAIARTVADAGLASSVILTGQRPDARELLPAFDAYVNCSTSEGVSLSILEAMAAGLPIVATRVGGTPEVVVHAQTGLLVPARSPENLAAALLQLSQAPERRQSMGACARARVVEHFSLAAMVDRYRRAYHELGAC